MLVLMLVFCGESAAGNMVREAARTYTLKSPSIACSTYHDACLVDKMVADGDSAATIKMVENRRCVFIKNKVKVHVYQTSFVRDQTRGASILVSYRKPGDASIFWTSLYAFEELDELLWNYHPEFREALRKKGFKP